MMLHIRIRHRMHSHAWIVTNLIIVFLSTPNAIVEQYYYYASILTYLYWHFAIGCIQWFMSHVSIFHQIHDVHYARFINGLWHINNYLYMLESWTFSNNQTLGFTSLNNNETLVYGANLIICRENACFRREIYVVLTPRGWLEVVASPLSLLQPYLSKGGLSILWMPLFFSQLQKDTGATIWSSSDSVYKVIAVTSPGNSNWLACWSACRNASLRRLAHASCDYW